MSLTARQVVTYDRNRIDLRAVATRFRANGLDDAAKLVDACAEAIRKLQKSEDDTQDMGSPKR